MSLAVEAQRVPAAIELCADLLPADFDQALGELCWVVAAHSKQRKLPVGSLGGLHRRDGV